MVRRLWVHRNLLYLMVQSQYRLRYRQSVIGIAWAVAPTLATLGVATIVFQKIGGVRSGSISYSTFTLAALIPWTFFANALTMSVASVVSNQLIVTRIPFPRAVFPLSTVGLSLVDMAIAVAIFVPFAYLTGDRVPITVLWFPVLLAIEIALVSGMALLTSAMDMFARDIRLAVPLAIQLWLFLTPVMYPLRSVPPQIRTWYRLNPMSGLVESFRQVMAYGSAPVWSDLLPSLIGAVFFLVIGYWYFATTEGRFADVI